MRSAGIGFWDWDFSTGVVLFDEQWASITGHTPDELAPDPSTWQMLANPLDATDVLFEVARCLRDDVAGFRFEQRMRHLDGRWIWTMGTGTVVAYDASGAPLRIVGTMQDISDSRHARDALLESEKRQDLAMQSVRLGLWDWNTATDALNFSARACEMIGYAVGELAPLAATRKQLGHPDDRAGPGRDRGLDRGLPRRPADRLPGRASPAAQTRSLGLGARHRHGDGARRRRPPAAPGRHL
jgi:PAS domain S-box-containing protein